jgi:hypothetical protein
VLHGALIRAVTSGFLRMLCVTNSNPINMKRKSIYFLSVLWALSTSCEEGFKEQPSTQNDVPQEIVLKLQKAGFSTEEGLRRYRDGYLVEYDIFLTASDINRLSAETSVSKNGRTEHFRTNELVAANPARVVTVFMDQGFTLFMQQAFTNALARYNNQNLRITFQAVADPVDADINIVPYFDNGPNAFLGFAGFPGGGNPFNTINLNTFFFNENRADAEAIIAHEIGHAIGFRHTDFMNRAFSCGIGGNEGDAGIGAVHIPGTPTTPSANSWMLACFNGVDRPFTGEDITALNTLYGRVNQFFTLARWATQQGGFWNEQQWAIGDFNGDSRLDFAKAFIDGADASLDVHPNVGQSFAIARWATQQGGFWNEQKWVTADFNADGRTDFAKAFDEGGLASIDVHLSNGSSFGIQRFATQQGGFWNEQKWFAGDFNNDGRADMAKVFYDGGLASIDVHVNTGAGFVLQRWATQQGGFWNEQQWVIGDFNGDGRLDFAKAFIDGGAASLDVHLNTGSSSFAIARWATQQGGFANEQKWVAADFNADGRTDFAKAFDDGGLASIDVHLSNGSSFGIERFTTQQGGFWNEQKWFAGDFNNDGRADMAKVFIDNGLASIDVHVRN